MTVRELAPSVRSAVRSAAMPGPRWARPALGGVLLLATVLYGWGLSGSGYANEYYSAAVKSGTESWKAFFFGSLDSASFITVDKPPMALWVQELSARVFGFGTWSLLLPEVVMGVAAVTVLYATVRRAFGPAAGLIAALVMTLTPITVAINHDNNPDTLLVLLLVLAAWACQRAVESGRPRWLMASAFFLGCGFNTKMLQAYLLLPALFFAYLLFAPGSRLRRVSHLAVAGVVLAISSFWWMVVVDLIPAADRPYIGGSTNNTVWDLVIGYNGLGRVLGGSGGLGGGGSAGGVAGGGPGRGGGPTFAGEAGWGRLFNPILGGQISWLLPFAAIALVTGMIVLWKRPRTDLPRAALVLWGGWLAVHFTIFSLADGTMHPYYTTALAPPIAALTGIGVMTFLDAHRRTLWWSRLVIAAIAVTGTWSFTLLRRTPGWHSWLAWTVAALTLTAVLASAVTLVRAARDRDRSQTTGFAEGTPSAEPTARGPRGAGSAEDELAADERAGKEPTRSTADRAARSRAQIRRTAPSRIAVLVAAVGMLAGLAGPAAYAVSGATSSTNGTNPLAGPSAGGFGMGGPGMGPGMGGPGMAGAGAPGGGQPPAAVRKLIQEGRLPGGLPRNGNPPSNGNLPPNGTTAPGGPGETGGTAQQRGGPPAGGGPGMGEASSQLIAYLQKHRDGATWLVAVTSAQSASPIILRTGLPVIAMGGFTGSDAAMTVTKLQAYVRAGKLHYVLTGGGGGPGGGGGVSTVTTWVTKNCTAVKTSEYTSGSTSAQTSSLYRCG